MALVSAGQVALKRSLSVKDGGWLLFRGPELNAAFDSVNSSMELQYHAKRIIIIKDDDNFVYIDSDNSTGRYSLSIIISFFFDP